MAMMEELERRRREREEENSGDTLFRERRKGEPGVRLSGNFRRPELAVNERMRGEQERHLKEAELLNQQRELWKERMAERAADFERRQKNMKEKAAGVGKAFRGAARLLEQARSAAHEAFRNPFYERESDLEKGGSAKAFERKPVGERQEFSVVLESVERLVLAKVVKAGGVKREGKLVLSEKERPVFNRALRKVCLSMKQEHGTAA